MLTLKILKKKIQERKHKNSKDRESYKLEFMTGPGLNKTINESLILAQDERWRRA